MPDQTSGFSIRTLIFGPIALLLLAGMIDGCEGCSDKYQDADSHAVGYLGKIVVTGIGPAPDAGFIGNRLSYDGDWRERKVLQYRELDPFRMGTDNSFLDRKDLQGVITTLSYDTARYTLMAGDTLEVQIRPGTTSIPFAALLSGGNRRRGFYIEQIANIESVYRTGGRAGRAIPLDNRAYSWITRNIPGILIAVAAIVVVALGLSRRKK
jgi:hypothetical protein